MEKLNNIINLSKLFILENNDNFFNLYDRENRRINKKSILFWLILLLFFGIFYLSKELITYLKQYGLEEIFLNGYFFILEIILIIQTIMVATNLFYFSKDTEHILPLPFKPIEIMVAKFNTIMFMLYFTELIIALLPFVVYGMMTNMGLLYFINLIFVLIIFPIFIVLFLSIIIMFLIKTIKFFKNKDIMQLVISIFLIAVIMGSVTLLFKYTFLNDESINQSQENLLNNNFNDNLIKINNYFLTINPSINILLENNIFKILFYFLELILINIVAFIIFIFLGNKFYLKQLLKNSFYTKQKYYKKINLNKKCKKNKIGIAYIKKEFKLLTRNPVFLVENIVPIITFTITIIILFLTLTPQVIEIFNSMEGTEELEFDFEAVCIILGLTQIIGLFNYSSLTAFSREGRDACIIKSFPINLYKQFIYKNIPQILINTILSIFVLGIIFYEIPAIQFKYIFIIFILNILLTFINSFILCIIDLINPKINWNAEYEISKNKNKLLQYVLIVFNVLFLNYFNNIFTDNNLDISLGIFAFILLFIFIIMNLLINKYKNKLFKKIS